MGESFNMIKIIGVCLIVVSAIVALKSVTEPKENPKDNNNLEDQQKKLKFNKNKSPQESFLGDF